MRIITVDHDLADVSTNGFATGLTGPGPFTTFTVSTPTDGIAHTISLTAPAANDLSAITMTILGTDADGISQTEARLGPGSSTTVSTAAYFKTIISITASVSLGALVMDVGWSAGSASRTIPINRLSDTATGLQVDVTGTSNFTVQQTYVPFNSSNEFTTVKTWATAIAAGTVDVVGLSGVGATGVRLITTSYSSTAELQMYVSSNSSV
jgi:hypothetical protein